jgi:hypothetical protein
MNSDADVPWWRRFSIIVLFGFLAVGGFYLFTEHRAHLYGALPYVLLLLCPLMHLFHRHGNNQHSHQGQSSDQVTTRENGGRNV